MYTIGQFSSATGIPVRTLRFYHEEGLLVPAAVDAETNYRTYDDRNLEVARLITALRGLEFSLDDVREILADCDDDTDVLAHLERHKVSIAKKLERYQNVSTADGIMVRELPASHCVSIVHPGPYEELSRSYARILHYAKSRGYNIQLPTREVYHKGPGMIFRGNPKKYVTEIQLSIATKA